MSACWNYRAKPSDIHTHLTMYTHSHTWPPTQIQTHARLLLNTTNRQAYNKSLIQLQNHLLIKKSYSQPFSLGLNQNCARHLKILFFFDFHYKYVIFENQKENGQVLVLNIQSYLLNYLCYDNFVKMKKKFC